LMVSIDKRDSKEPNELWRPSGSPQYYYVAPA